MAKVRNGLYTLDPAAKKDFSVDWSQWLATDEVIASSTWILPASGITQSTSPAPSYTDTVATVWLEAGVVRAAAYTVTNRITTDQGRTDDASLTVTVKDQ